jgi:AraC family transcriptional regulator
MFQKPYNLSQNQLERVYDYIQTNISSQIEVQELANLVHLSPCYFMRLFKCSTGLSPQQYIIKFRLDIATNLLSTTDLQVSQIALLVGYKNPDCLSSTFSRHLLPTFRTSIFTTKTSERNYILNGYIIVNSRKMNTKIL